MNDAVTVIVPARNETETIARVIYTMQQMDHVAEVLVVDNASEDNTAEIAQSVGARVVYEPRPGMGHAVRAGLLEAKHQWVMKVDADLDRFDTKLFERMTKARATGVGLVKGQWHDPKDNMPMTRLLVMPAIRQMFPGLATLNAPNSGIYLVNKSYIACEEIIGDYAADIDVMLRVYAAGAEIKEVDIGRIQNNTRNLNHYNAMAEIIMAFFLSQREKRITEELVVFARNADEVIHNTLGLIATKARHGGRVSLFLEKQSGADQILQSTLGRFPTVEVLPLLAAEEFALAPTSDRLRVIAPYPEAADFSALKSALRLQSRDHMAEQAELLLTPMSQDRDKVSPFFADQTLDISHGLEIKSRAVTALTGRTRQLGSRELFQSYDSLPEGLRIAIGGGGKHDRGVI